MIHVFYNPILQNLLHSKILFSAYLGDAFVYWIRLRQYSSFAPVGMLFLLQPIVKNDSENLLPSNVPIHTQGLFSFDLEGSFCLVDFSYRESSQTSGEAFCSHKLQFKSDPSTTHENIPICNSLQG